MECGDLRAQTINLKGELDHLKANQGRLEELKIREEKCVISLNFASLSLLFCLCRCQAPRSPYSLPTLSFPSPFSSFLSIRSLIFHPMPRYLETINNLKDKLHKVQNKELTGTAALMAKLQVGVQLMRANRKCGLHFLPSSFVTK